MYKRKYMKIVTVLPNARLPYRGDASVARSLPAPKPSIPRIENFSRFMSWADSGGGPPCRALLKRY